MKLGMISLDRSIKERKLNSKILLQVHDELVLNVPKEELKIILPLLKSSLEDVVSFSIPLKVDIGSGSNWLEAH